MTMNKFIEELTKKLFLLEKNVLNEEIKYYENDINKRKNNESIDSIINSYGNIDIIATNIYHKHGIDYKKINNKESRIYKMFQELVEVIHNIIDEMGSNNFKQNLKIIVDILILLALIALLKIPFIALQNIGETLLGYLSVPVLITIWDFVLDMGYIVVAIIIFVNIFNKYFKNIKSNNKKMSGKPLESINLEEK